MRIHVVTHGAGHGVLKALGEALSEVGLRAEREKRAASGELRIEVSSDASAAAALIEKLAAKMVGNPALLAKLGRDVRNAAVWVDYSMMEYENERTATVLERSGALSPKEVRNAVRKPMVRVWLGVFGYLHPAAGYTLVLSSCVEDEANRVARALGSRYRSVIGAVIGRAARLHPIDLAASSSISLSFGNLVEESRVVVAPITPGPYRVERFEAFELEPLSSDTLVRAVYRSGEGTVLGGATLFWRLSGDVHVEGGGIALASFFSRASKGLYTRVGYALNVSAFLYLETLSRSLEQLRIVSEVLAELRRRVQARWRGRFLAVPLLRVRGNLVRCTTSWIDEEGRSVHSMAVGEAVATEEGAAEALWRELARLFGDVLGSAAVERGPRLGRALA